ncbi:MAG: hypothetical protein AAF458_17025 [Pseudomonadota bacterium]
MTRLLAVLLLLASSSVSAVIIQIDYTGTVGSTVPAGLTSSFSVGDAVTGSLRYDTDGAFVSNVLGNGAGITRGYNALVSFEISIGAYTVSSSGGGVFVADGNAGNALAPKDSVTFAAYGLNSPLGLNQTLSENFSVGASPSRLQFQLLSAANATVLPDASLPSLATTTSFIAANTSGTSTNLVVFEGAGLIRYNLSSVSASVVTTPAPASALLMLVPAMWLVGVGARRRNRAASA